MTSPIHPSPCAACDALRDRLARRERWRRWLKPPGVPEHRRALLFANAGAFLAVLGMWCWIGGHEWGLWLIPMAMAAVGEVTAWTLPVPDA